MKVKTLSALAGLGGALIMSSAANAAFIGVTIQNENLAILSHTNANVKASYIAAGGAAAFTVYRVYANFDAVGGVGGDNRVNTIFGAPDGRPFTLSSTSGSFFNVVGYYDDGDPDTDNFSYFDTPPTAPGDFNSPTTNTLTGDSPAGRRGWETYVGPGFVQNPGTSLIIGPGSFDPGQANHLQGNFSATNFAVTMTPDNAGGNASATIPAGGSPLAPGAAGRVFLMQLTVAVGTDITGIVGLSIGGGTGLAGGATEVWGNNTSFTTVIPAPGALALLGLAGLVGARRRRA